jgi:hypothetical protein
VAVLVFDGEDAEAREALASVEEGPVVVASDAEALGPAGEADDPTAGPGVVSQTGSPKQKPAGRGPDGFLLLVLVEDLNPWIADVQCI